MKYRHLWLVVTIALAVPLAACGGSSSSANTSSHHSRSHHSRSHHSRSHRSTRRTSRSARTSTGPQPPSKLLAPRTRTSGCRVRGALQDSACTPGAIFAGVTKGQVCVPGYSRKVRNVSSSTKRQAYTEYGIASHRPGQFEVDHLVSLELGGSNSIANLWPEAASPQPGFHQKDQVENYLHDQMCSGRISLGQAQHEIATNWLTVYRAMGH